MLGRREPAVYGNTTLTRIETGLTALAAEAGYQLETLQSNAEHELIERIQAAAEDDVRVILINPGAYGHTSIALRDALAACGKPFIEIHISNIYARESFRHHSHLTALAAGSIVGLGVYGYELALQAALRLCGRSCD
jgi:3-dehydroquinate dehydratase-2